MTIGAIFELFYFNFTGLPKNNETGETTVQNISILQSGVLLLKRCVFLLKHFLSFKTKLRQTKI